MILVTSPSGFVEDFAPTVTLLTKGYDVDLTALPVWMRDLKECDGINEYRCSD